VGSRLSRSEAIERTTRVRPGSMTRLRGTVTGNGIISKDGPARVIGRLPGSGDVATVVRVRTAGRDIYWQMRNCRARLLCSQGRGNFFGESVEKSCGTQRAPASSEAVGRKFLNRRRTDGLAGIGTFLLEDTFGPRDARRVTLARVGAARTHEPRARDTR